MTNPGTRPGMWNVRTAAHGSLRGGSKMREKYNLFTCILYVRRVNAVWPCNIKRWNGMTSCMQQESKHLEWLKQLVQMVCVFFRTELFFFCWLNVVQAFVHQLRECERSCATVCACVRIWWFGPQQECCSIWGSIVRMTNEKSCLGRF